MTANRKINVNYIVNYSNMIFYNLLSVIITIDMYKYYWSFKTDKTNVFKVKHANVPLNYWNIYLKSQGVLQVNNLGQMG